MNEIRTPPWQQTNDWLTARKTKPYVMANDDVAKRQHIFLASLFARCYRSRYWKFEFTGTTHWYDMAPFLHCACVRSAIFLARTGGHFVDAVQNNSRLIQSREKMAGFFVTKWNSSTCHRFYSHQYSISTTGRTFCCWDW